MCEEWVECKENVRGLLIPGSKQTVLNIVVSEKWGFDCTKVQQYSNVQLTFLSGALKTTITIAIFNNTPEH